MSIRREPLATCEYWRESDDEDDDGESCVSCTTFRFRPDGLLGHGVICQMCDYEDAVNRSVERAEARGPVHRHCDECAVTTTFEPFETGVAVLRLEVLDCGNDEPILIATFCGLTCLTKFFQRRENRYLRGKIQ